MSRPIFTPGHAITWIIDFDGTLTKKDTLDALVNIAVKCKPETLVQLAWHDCTQAYISDYAAALEKLAPDNNLPTTIIAERKLLKDLEVAEQKSIDRVSASGIFSGLTAAQLETGAAKAVESGEVQLRDGTNEFLHRLQMRFEKQDLDLDEMGVLSVNWSQNFICACIRAAQSGCSQTLPNLGFTLQLGASQQYGLTRIKNFQLEVDVEGPSNMFIYANELEGVEKGGQSTGKISGEGCRKIISSHDKLTALQMLRKLSPYTMKPIPVVYIGDSWTDFECLLAADLGICIRDDPMASSQKTLEGSFRRLGIHCPHIDEWEAVDEWGVVWAKDFVEIQQWTEKMESPVTTT